MELDKKMAVKVAFLLFLMGFSATVEAGRQLDPSFIITQVLNNGDASYLRRSSSSEECCKACACTLEYPVGRCICADVTESCPAACKSCVCTRSIPPQCYCADYAVGNCYIPACLEQAPTTVV